MNYLEALNHFHGSSRNINSISYRCNEIILPNQLYLILGNLTLIMRNATYLKTQYVPTLQKCFYVPHEENIFKDVRGDSFSWN